MLFRLDVMLHTVHVDCIFQMNQLPYNARFIRFHIHVREFNGNWPEICNLPRVTSRLISKLDIEYDL